MYARMTRVEVPPERLDAMAEHFQQTVPTLQSQDGFRGYVLLGDRATGSAMSLTYWESEDAMRASEETGNQMRQRVTQAGGASSAPVVERFEVVAQG
jgi:heme-degrading monooxygenase HmoA